MSNSATTNKLKVEATAIHDVVVIEPRVFGDERGWFTESFNALDFSQATGLSVDFVQDNHSRSRKGTLRGMHFQTVPGQAKLVRAARGSVVDVAVDLRTDSPTFGEWEAFELTDENMQQLFVPVGFAHGFCVTSEVADFTYRCSNYYDPATEAGIAWDDPDVGIVWPQGIDILVSDRDREAPSLAEVRETLPFRLRG